MVLEELFGFAEYFLDSFLEFILEILNAPILPFLGIIKDFLTKAPSIELFGSLWGLMVFLISLFYGIFILLAGFNLIISGPSASRREQAKAWLQNVILMMIFVQSSYFIYNLVGQIASGLSSGVVQLIDNNFFLLTLDNPLNVGLEVVLGFFYLMILFITILFLSSNYFFASIGVIFAPWAFFLYFIPPLRDIGKFIMNISGFMLFVPFIASLILLGASKLVEVGYLNYVKIILMISSFGMVNVLMILLAIFAIVRSVMTVLRTDLFKGVLMLKGSFVLGSLLNSDKKKK